VAALRSNPVSDQGGSFTIYDLQASGLTSFTAVINPPQAAILAVASGPGPVLNATLSLDVRVGDDLLAAKWLSAFQLALDNLGL
jgi:pyruvate dehydrogenase E2 component (dihydrolipoamide acetyltransferase)